MFWKCLRVITGRPAYYRARMLKILLFAYSRKVFSGRKIAQILTENLPMMYLADQQTMSYHTINNFCTSKHANQPIKKCFLYFNHLLQEECLVYERALFIDGTKIEADDNKYSFVWRKVVDRFQAKLQDETLALYQELVEEEVVKAMAAEEVQSSHGLNQLAVLGDFDTIVADAGYGSEYNYAELTDHFGKQFLIPYTTYEKEQKRKYRHDPTKLDNWYYDETEDYYLDHQGVRFNFKRYSTRHDRYGFTRQFKVYEADEFQLNAAKTALAKTSSGRQRKLDVEPIFGHLKNIFGMCQIYLIGQAKVENDLGLMLMTTNLSKY